MKSNSAISAAGFFTIAAALAWSTSTNSAIAQGTQSVLDPPVDAFVTATNALAKSANERVDLGRASLRLAELRTQLTEKILAAAADEKVRLDIDAKRLLCDVRAANVEVAARRNYLQAVAGKVEAVGRPSKIDNLESAFKALFAGQSLDMTTGIPTIQELDADRKKIQERCENDLSGFTLAYYGKNIVSSEQLAQFEAGPIGVFGPIGALIDAIISVITPAVVEGSKFVDEERRRNAVLTFLQDPENIKKIEDSGVALAKEVSAFTWDKRLRLAGAFYEQSAVLRSTEIDTTKDSNCKTYISTRRPTSADGKILTDDFVLCWRAAWAQIEGPVASLLKAAEQYDQLADAGDTDNAKKAFEPLAKSLTAISTEDPKSVAKFWRWATRLVAFAQKVETAFSKENRQKIDKAIDDLVRAF